MATDGMAERKEKLKNELQGMALAAGGTFFLLALLSFNTSDRTANSYSTGGGFHNLGGMFGAQAADLLLSGFGLAAYIIPGTLLYLAYRLLRFKELKWRSYKGFAFVGLLV